MSSRALISLGLFAAIASAIAPTAEPALACAVTNHIAVNFQLDDRSVTSRLVRSETNLAWSSDPEFVVSSSAFGLPTYPSPTRESESCHDAIANVPPPPSSLLISVASLLGLGVLVGGKYVAGNIASSPAWYHDGGPQQIGYATPFPFNLTELSSFACELSVPFSLSLARPTSRIRADCRFDPVPTVYRNCAGPRAPPTDC